jgi:Glycosyl hydrolases family 15
VFVQHYDTTALDASVLLLPLVRFLPADDERVRATVLAVAEELSVDGLVLRYRTDQTDDGLTGAEGTFTTCSFWLVSALVEIGETARARRLCEKLLSYDGPLGLYAEELDPHTGRHLGNFPQAFTHLALINAVIHVIRAEDPRATLQFFPPRHTSPDSEGVRDAPSPGPPSHQDRSQPGRGCRYFDSVGHRHEPGCVLHYGLGALCGSWQHLQPCSWYCQRPTLANR